MIKVSVVVPVYNVENYLRQCLDSILAQTLTDIEIICVDDGSSDSSLQILEEYAKKDPRVIVRPQKNAGAGAARNNGLSVARGKYVSFLDSDDFFEPTLLEKLYEKAEADHDDISICLSDQYYTDRREYVPVSWPVRLESIPPYQPFSWQDLSDNPFKVFVGWAWDKLFLRSFVEEHELQFQVQRTSNDMLFVFSAIVLAESMSVVPEVLVHQRRDASDSLSKTREHSWHCFHDALAALKERLVKEDLYEELEQDYINYALHFSLWNYRTLAEPTKSLLKDKLLTEWFAEFGIEGKPRDYFYLTGEWDEMIREFYPERIEEMEAARAADKETKENQKAEISAILNPAKKAGASGSAASGSGAAKGSKKKEPDTPASWLKRKMRHFVPVSHTYLDRALNKQSRKIDKMRDHNAKIVQQMLNTRTSELKREIALAHDETRVSIEDARAHNADIIARMLDARVDSINAATQRMLNTRQDELKKYVRDTITTENKKTVKEMKDYLDQELTRRDEWGRRAAEIELKARAEKKPLWMILCPAPNDETKLRWGDYPYAMSLKKYLERNGVYVVVDFREDWNMEIEADVVLVLRGAKFFRPDRRRQNTTYIMWNISHPDYVTEEEYSLYDLVCVASKRYAEELRPRLLVPVAVLQQCTDTEEFCPESAATDAATVETIATGVTTAKAVATGSVASDTAAAGSVTSESEAHAEGGRKYDFLFIGNSRGIARRPVMWSVEENLPLTIIGSGWNKILEDHMDLIVAPFIENDKIPALYRASKCTLNDHWDDMLRNHFVNNRIFDALACGLPVISDASDELMEIFPDAVLYYSDKESFDKAVAEIENNYDAVKARVDAQWPLIREHYSFEARAKELIALAAQYTHKAPAADTATATTDAPKPFLARKRR